MDKIEVVRSEVVEPSSKIKGLAAPTGVNASFKQKGDFGAIPHLSDPELAAFRSWLNLNQHNHPEPAKPFAYNMIEQIERKLDGEFAKGAFGTLFGYQLRHFVMAGGVPPAH